MAKKNKAGNGPTNANKGGANKDAGEDRRGGCEEVHLHCRRFEDGRDAGQVSVAGRGDSDGARLRRP